MVRYAVGIDKGSAGLPDQQILDGVASAIQQACGAEVKKIGIGSNAVPAFGQTSGASGYTAVYITNGRGLQTPEDFEVGIGRYYNYDFCIFVWAGELVGNPYLTVEYNDKYPVPPEHDWNRDASFGPGTMYAKDFFNKKSNISLVIAQSFEEIGKGVCAGGNYAGSGPSTAGGQQQESQKSELLSGEWTFEELIAYICDGVDIQFIPKKTNIVVTDFESLFAEAKWLRDKHADSVEGENLHFWQLEDGSYEEQINQFGFYNSVKVNYKNGSVVEEYDDLVRNLGQIQITYDHKNLDKTSAIIKAKAYLAAHVREFELKLNSTILASPEIDIGDIVTFNNPFTMRDSYKADPEYLFVSGYSTEWEDGGAIKQGLELSYGPIQASPPEVPTTGSNGADVEAESISEEAKAAFEELKTQLGEVSYDTSCSSASCLESNKKGDSKALSEYIANFLNGKNIQNKIVQYEKNDKPFYSVVYVDGNSWKNVPYSEIVSDTNFLATSAALEQVQESQTNESGDTNG